MKKIFGILLCAAAVLTVSCERQEQPFSTGKAVKFTTSVGTRTALQGYAQDGIEAVLWEDGDVFTVWSEQASVAESDQKWADYKVSASAGVATAVNPATEGVELLWGEGTHTFFAGYPAGKLDGNKLSANIPVKQKLNKLDNNFFGPALSEIGYMAAAAQAQPDAVSVNLAFKPLFTVFEFIVSAGETAEVTVTDFRLGVQEGSKVVLAGNFIANLSAQASPEIVVDYSNTSGDIKASFGDTGVKLPKGETLSVSVIALPIDLSALIAYFTVDGKEIAVPLVKKDGSPILFPAGQKARITALGVLAPETPPTPPTPADPVGITVEINGIPVTDYDISKPSNAVTLLPGVFTIGNKKVRFSKGNLQAVLENGAITKWQFAEHQWDVAKNASDFSGDTGVIDGFGVSTTAPKNRWGTHYWGVWNLPPEVANMDMDADPDAYDLALRQIADDYHVGKVTYQWENPDFTSEYGTGWTILSPDDVFELLLEYEESTYPPHSGEWKWYKAHFTSAKVEGVDGIVLFPDDFQKPADVDIVPIEELLTDSVMGAFAYTAALNTYSAQKWAVLEEAGAVFLPISRYFHTKPGVDAVAYDDTPSELHNEFFFQSLSDCESGMVTYVDYGLYQTTVSAVRDGRIRLIQVVE